MRAGIAPPGMPALDLGPGSIQTKVQREAPGAAREQAPHRWHEQVDAWRV